MHTARRVGAVLLHVPFALETEWLLHCIALHCIVLYCNPLSPEDYFPGSPVKVEQQTYTTHNTVKQLVNQNQSAVLMVGGCHFFPMLLEASPCHPISFDHWSSLELLGHLHLHPPMHACITTNMLVPPTCDHTHH